MIATRPLVARRISVCFLGGLFVLLTACTALRGGGGLPKDTQADFLVAQGQRQLMADDLDGAADSFEKALQRPANRQSSVATYLSGLTYLKLEWNELAIQRFETLTTKYPRSRYAPEAKYHLALLGLNARQDAAKADAIGQLLKLAAEMPGQVIAADAETAARQALFQRGGPELPALSMPLTPKSHQHLVMEAWSYRDIMAGNRNAALLRYQTYRKEGGQETPFLKSLFPDAAKPVSPSSATPGPARMALMLPLHLDEMNYDPESSAGILGMDFYEGFRLALEEHATLSRRPVFVRMYDTKRDSLLKPQFTRSLDSLQPAVVVGGIFNGFSRNLNQWAETKGITQVVPISATQELVLGKNHIFLAHPSTADHGTRMAHYARNVARLRNVVVFTDGNEATDQLATAFMDAFTSGGGRATRVKYNFQEKGNLSVIRSALVAGVDGVYLPYLNNEESANLVLTQLVDKKLVVMGSPHFKTRYLTIDRQLKERLELVFSTSHFVDPLDPLWQAFERRFIERYATQPSEFAIQGYDLGLYLARQLEAWNPQGGIPFSSYLRTAPPKAALHIAYDFRGAQSNQYVNLGRFTPDGIEKME